MATRINNPFIRHLNKSSPYDPLASGQLFFYEPGTTTFKDTFSDRAGLIANTNPVVLDASGLEPDIYGDGSYRVILKSSVSTNSLQQSDRDPVNFENEEGAFGDWLSTIDYGAAGDNIVVGSDGNYYVSITTPNLNNDPTSSPTFWTEFDLLKRWNTNETYELNDPVIGSNGQIYTSTINSNTGDDPLDGTGDWTVPTVNNHANYIINGNFLIWQRSTSFTTAGINGDDRWATNATGSTFVATRQTFTLGQTDVPNNPKFFSRTVVTTSAGAGNSSLKQQNIENVLLLSNQKITLSFWAKADSSKNIATEFIQGFGTGGSPSSDVNTLGVTTHALTTSWVKKTVTFTTPSISGKTLGSAGNSIFALVFWFDAGTNFDSRTNSLGQQSGTFEIANVQVEKGSTSTNFEYRQISEELSLCQRYYEKSYDQDVDPGTMDTNGANDESATRNAANETPGIKFKVTKRAAPTVTLYGTASGYSGNITNSGDKVAVASSIGDSGVRVITITTGSAASGVSYHWTADSEL